MFDGSMRLGGRQRSGSLGWNNLTLICSDLSAERAGEGACAIFLWVLVEPGEKLLESCVIPCLLMEGDPIDITEPIQYQRIVT